MPFSPNYFIYAKLTLKEKEAPANSITLYVGNRSPINESSLTIYPVLKNISGIGAGLSGNVPELGRGRIDIDNTRNAFGFQKRFVDYLDKYTIIGQEVLIYLAKVSENDTNVSGDATLFWSDTVNNVDFRGDTVSLSLRSDQIANVEFTAKTDPNVFTNCPTNSLGQSVPFVIGAGQQVKPILVDASATYTNYAYATTLKRQFCNSGIKKLYCKDHDGDYVLVSSDQGSGLLAYNYGDLDTDGYSLSVATADHAALAGGVGGVAFLSDNSASTAEEHGAIIYGACIMLKKRSESDTFTASAAANTITLTTDELGNYMKVRFTTTGTLPAPLATGTDYYLASTILPGIGGSVHTLSTTYEKALANEVIDLTTAGTGTHTVTVQIPDNEKVNIEAYEALKDNDSGLYQIGNLITKTEDIIINDLPNGWHKIYLSFLRPVVVGSVKPVYFAIKSNFQDYSASQHTSISYRVAYREGNLGVDTERKTIKQKKGIESENGEWINSTPAFQEKLALELYACTYTDNGTPPVSVYALANGLATSYFTLTHDNANFTAPDMSSLDFIFEIDGIEDDSSGTITGVANQLITLPHHVAELLTYNYDGSNWVNNIYDSSTYSGTHTRLSATGYYSRSVAGASNGVVRARQLLNDVMNEHACYLTKVNTTNKLALYAWGTQQAIAFTIYDIDILDFRYTVADRSTIVNVARGSYYKKLTSLNERRVLAQGGEKSYSGYLEYRYNDASLGQAISANSYTLFSDNENIKDTYNYVADATTMRNVLHGILSRNQLPSELVEVTLPLHKFSTLKLWDVVKVITSQLPQTGGTNPDPLPSVYNAGEEIIYNTDDQLVLAKPYRGQVLKLDYDLSRDVPSVTVLINLLINKADPT
jgi:hypothetical protein